jgi:hypothetical protein
MRMELPTADEGNSAVALTAMARPMDVTPNAARTMLDVIKASAALAPGSDKALGSVVKTVGSLAAVTAREETACQRAAEGKLILMVRGIRM